MQLGAGNQGVATGDALSFGACFQETQSEPENEIEAENEDNDTGYASQDQ
jgi:hypothetical protein